MDQVSAERRSSGVETGITRRRLLHRGAKLAYVTPVILSTIALDPAFVSASGGGGGGGGGGNDVPTGRSHGYYAHNGQAFVPSSLTLGFITYSNADLIAILNYGGPDFLPKLAYQLITAEINGQFFPVPANVQTAIDFANALIGNLNIIPLGTNTLSSSATATINGTTKTASEVDNTLDSFNSP